MPIWVVLGHVIALRQVKDKNQISSPLYAQNGQTGEKILSVSKIYDFNDLRIYKKYKGSFNDFMMTHVSSVLREMFEEHGVTDNMIVNCAVPAGLGKPPTCLKEVKFQNRIVMLRF